MDDLLELEIAFTAFSKALIAALLHPDAPSGESLSEVLLAQAQALRQPDGIGHSGAASQLERLAAFALDRQAQILLLQTPTPGSPH